MFLLTKNLQFKKFGLTAMAFIIAIGYLVSFFTDMDSDSPVFSIVKAQGPFVMMDTYGMEITDEYISRFEISTAKEIANIKSNAPEVLKIKNYLNLRGAPLAAEAETFVRIADKYDLPYNLMPAISVIESNGGKAAYRPYNYAGMGGQGAAMTFNSWEQAIEKHAKILKFGYFDKGANTPEKIEKFYCYQCPTWGEKVTLVMNNIDSTKY
jgi:hypothetical protein